METRAGSWGTIRGENKQMKKPEKIGETKTFSLTEGYHFVFDYYRSAGNGWDR